ncbi:hypothetical protein GCM10010532_086480 [Dactylosporangium siamense]|uniref:Uncharacterized protein n=1 Tax=Dactylosporangium siamense TaxID=685454 RepID=A0A919PUK6_9ACTN|nr:hypothetical protein Dsi01nite_067340 [Dactylosporangium siamense]
MTTEGDESGGSDQDMHGRAAVRFDHAAVGEKLSGVLEDDHSVAQEAPPLFGVRGRDPGGFVVGVGG